MNINRTQSNTFSYGETARRAGERGPAFVRRPAHEGGEDRVEISREARERAADLRVPAWVRRITARLAVDDQSARGLVARVETASAAARAGRVDELRRLVAAGNYDFDGRKAREGAAAGLAESLVGA